ncbi:translocation/assembly module TamB domain-containing protein [Colwellia sp. D2M02]|uniref:translocation/assembly module TamB domain-containing protein n=1 Tax=Colwellia sp. D2M02 TaxID=2841562 RepID=UPI001C0918D7|nr:translocation/assembly module TamB domain-containing protein [Colwellia sp. D2M02]MBU2894580.1 translocation/assembly module TamB domain-containing protein [Colwellia sp. D2M02]
MTKRQLSFSIAKYATLLLCLFTILVTTPWGTQLTLSLLNNIDGFEADYKAGSLVRDIELNSIHLNFSNLSIEATNAVAIIDFSCIWQKKLCIDSLNISDFTLTHWSDSTTDTNIASDNVLITMPFAIDAPQLTIANSQITLNNTLITVSQFTSSVAINNSDFAINTPNAKQVIVTLLQDDISLANKSTMNTAPNSLTKGDALSAIHSSISDLPEVHLPIALTIKELALVELQVIKNTAKATKTKSETQQSLLWHSYDHTLSASWTQHNVAIDAFSFTTQDYAINSAAASLTLTMPYEVNAELTTQIHQLEFWPEIANSAQTLNIQGSLDNLALTLQSQGSLILNSQAQLNLIQAELPFTVQLNAEKLPLPLSITQSTQPSIVTLKASGDIKQQALTLNSNINSYGYNNADFAIAAKHQQGLVTIEELTFDDQKSSSQLNLQGSVDTRTNISNIVQWQLNASSTGFTLPELDLATLAPAELLSSLPFQQLAGRVNGQIDSSGLINNNHWYVSINNTELTGNINNSPLLIEGDITLNNEGHVSSGALKSSHLHLLFNDSELTLQAQKSDNWQLIGQLTINNLNQWHHQIHGALQSKFTVQGEQSNPTINLNSELAHFTFKQLQSDKITIKGDYRPLNSHEIQLNISSDRLSLQQNKQDSEPTALALEQFSFSLAGDINQHKVDTSWQGDLGGAITFEGQWQQNLKQWRSEIAQVSFSHQGFVWQNNHSFSLDIDVEKQLFSLEKHCILGEGLKLCLPQNATLGNTGDVTLNIDIDLGIIDQLFLPKEVQLKSTVNGILNATWSATQNLNASGNFELSRGNIKVIDEYTDQQVSQWHQGKLTFTINEKQLNSQFVLSNKNALALLNMNTKMQFNDDFPISGKMALNNFNLQPFQSFSGAIVSLQGELSAELAIHGSLQSPLVSGNLQLNQGDLLLRENPNKLQNINAAMQIKNNIAQLDASFDIDNNKADINGELAWQQGLSLDLDLKSPQLPLIFPPQLTMKVAPTLNFNLHDKVLLVSGKLDVLSGNYNIEKLPEGSVTLSDDVVIVDQQGQELTQKAASLDIQTDIQVNIDKAFTISGQGLKSQLFGQLHISQKEQNPLQLFGRIHSDQGTFQAYGQRLAISQGELTFNGPVENPYVNLRASRYIKNEDVEVGITVTGLADTLEMQLFSTPSMQTSEMLSYLVRGRSLDSGGNSSNSEAATNMLIGLGVSSSESLFKVIEEIPLISDVSVDTESDGDTTQATISGYIGNRIYLKYGRGIDKPINELTVRMYLLNRLWLEVVSGLEHSTDIYYSFDIE